MAEELLGGTPEDNEDFRRAQSALRARSEEAVRLAEEAADAKPEVRVVIADDQDLVRNGFRLILSSYENLRVVGEADNGREAYEVARKEQPDVVLMDIRMPVENGIEATKRIMADPETAHIKVLILTTFDMDEYVYDALSAGASGFMLKDSEPDDIAEAIAVVAQGDALIQPSVMRRLVETFVEQRGAARMPSPVLRTLTEREYEVFEMIARGLSNDEIADRLVISTATVKTHVSRIMAKLNMHDRVQLVVMAYEEGIVVPGRS